MKGKGKNTKETVATKTASKTEKKRKKISSARSFICENKWMMILAIVFVVICVTDLFLSGFNIIDEDINNAIGTVSNLLGIFTIIPACGAWLKVKSLENRFKLNYVNAAKSGNEDETVNLLISVHNSCQSDVASFIEGKKIPGPELEEMIVYEPGTKKYFSIVNYGNVNKAFYHICCDESMPSSDIYKQNDFLGEYYSCLSHISTVFQKQGKSRVNLFIAGPTIMGTPIGNVFSNRFEIVLYQLNTSGNASSVENKYLMLGCLPKRI